MEQTAIAKLFLLWHSSSSRAPLALERLFLALAEDDFLAMMPPALASSYGLAASQRSSEFIGTNSEQDTAASLFKTQA
jgi:hypothetical protein